MEIDKNKQQKKLERKFIRPNLRPFLALTIVENTDVEDEFAVESEDGMQRKTVQQKIKTDPETKVATFITEIKYEQKIDDTKAMREDSTITYLLPVGTVLIWEENEGYIATEEGFQTLDEIEADIKLLKE